MGAPEQFHEDPRYGCKFTSRLACALLWSDGEGKGTEEAIPYKFLHIWGQVLSDCGRYLLVLATEHIPFKLLSSHWLIIDCRGRALDMKEVSQNQRSQDSPSLPERNVAAPPAMGSRGPRVMRECRAEPTCPISCKSSSTLWLCAQHRSPSSCGKTAYIR